MAFQRARDMGYYFGTASSAKNVGKRDQGLGSGWPCGGLQKCYIDHSKRSKDIWVKMRQVHLGKRHFMQRRFYSEQTNEPECER